MTEEQIMKAYEEMIELFGDKLPNPEHYPRMFAHFVLLYKYYKGLL